MILPSAQPSPAANTPGRHYRMCMLDTIWQSIVDMAHGDNIYCLPLCDLASNELNQKSICTTRKTAQWYSSGMGEY